ncbi:acyltransferase [Pseudomonas sp. GD03858]|uniref:acyltransferase family protein n=1 Tax=unclassified Pseudomonas TaxID=196821 RepID=UPI00244AAF16|nr:MULTISPECIES: acyltransferase family protein [unclassified Pseudomonas]MDH0645567.1 acyltransferase [Pseudomonas sp. GD03867]MDH0663295.1 acyltransferase [Pseudomonas sp. GD03858]
MTSLKMQGTDSALKNNGHLSYRPDIDGLRALAVLPVILFHAGLNSFRGGFVGVDIFFLISGFLITSIILMEKNAGTFKLSSFYSRRAKRILPALFLVIACTIPFAWYTLPPAEMQSFAQSILATLTFSSNILFWMQSGYFDTTASLKPLLHTWSLAVEEQYYIIFPLIILALWKTGTRSLTMLLCALLVMSLAFSVWLYGKDQTGAFYLLPARAWEILTGALIAMIGWKPTSSRLTSIMSALGLVLVLVSIFAYKKMAHLGALHTLPAVVGAALIIQFSREGSLVYRLLTLRAALLVGMLSYSAYLWHQPVLALAKLHFSQDLSKPLITLLIALTFVLSIISYRLIENPARRTKGRASNAVISAALAAGMALAVVGYIGNANSGFPERAGGFYPLTAQQAEHDLLQRFTNDSQDSAIYRTAEAPAKTILIIGDSYVPNWSIGINENIDHKQYRTISISYLHCQVDINSSRITVTTTESKYEKNCSAFDRYANDKEILKSVEKIFLVSHRPFEYQANKFRFELLKALKARTGAEAYIFGDYYQLDSSKGETCMNTMFASGKDSRACLEKAIYPATTQIQTSSDVPSDLNYHFVDVIELLCGYQKAKCPASVNGVPFMEDWNHLTATFVKHVFSSIPRSSADALRDIGLADTFH